MFGEITLLMVLQGAALVAAGAAAGYFLALNNFDKQRDKLKDELERSRAELKEQREKVDSHFLKTAQLFNRLTDDYREIYEHLATGAQTLCSPRISTPQLDQPETRVLPAIEGSAAESEAASDTEKAATEPSKPDTEAEAKDSGKTATETAAETATPEEAAKQKTKAETPPPKASGSNKPSDDEANIGADATPAPTAAGEEKPAAAGSAAAASEEKEKGEEKKEEKKEEKPGAEDAAATTEADKEKPAAAVPSAAKAAADIDRHKTPPSIH